MRKVPPPDTSPDPDLIVKPSLKATARDALGPLATFLVRLAEREIAEKKGAQEAEKTAARKGTRRHRGQAG
jgi:hypothetical protein